MDYSNTSHDNKKILTTYTLMQIVYGKIYVIPTDVHVSYVKFQQSSPVLIGTPILC